MPFSRILLTAPCVFVLACAASYSLPSGAPHSEAVAYESEAYAEAPASGHHLRADGALLVAEGRATSTAAASRQAQRGPAAPPARPASPPPSSRALADTTSVQDDAGAETRYRSDAIEGPLLIYTAQVTLSAFEVTDTLDAAISLVEAAGGHVQRRARERVVLRVPAHLFREVLDELQSLGDVLDSQWHAEDVSEAYRDTQIRLRNAMAARDRVEALLAQAESVEDVLSIEHQLQRLTLEIEQAMGMLRAMTDRILLSTITLEVRRRTSATPPTASRLPFPWLRTLGLPTLMRL